MPMTPVVVTGNKGSSWNGSACILPFGRLARLDEDDKQNPNDKDELAVRYETEEIIWDTTEAHHDQ